jgi:hypothetical protein
VRKGEDVSKEKIKTKRKKRGHAVLGWQGKGRVRAMDEKEINRGASLHSGTDLTCLFLLPLCATARWMSVTISCLLRMALNLGMGCVRQNFALAA